MLWSYGDNAETSFSAQAYANQEIFGGVGSTTDLVQQAINYFEAANTDLRDAFLNATTTTNTHRTLQTAYNEGKSAWEGIIALLDNTTDYTLTFVVLELFLGAVFTIFNQSRLLQNSL